MPVVPIVHRGEWEVSTHRKIDPAPFLAAAGDLPKVAFGPRSTVRWLPVAQLLIDERYQRVILGSGRKNVVRIAREFEWAKFIPVIVADLEKNRYAILDGQHRTTAAAVRGIEQVPCMIVKADPAKQAEIFAAINGQITTMSPMQLHAARVAAGDPRAVRLAQVCVAAGVTICRYPVPANNMKAGETLAAGTLYRLLDKYGDAVLKAALKCLTKTRGGYPGYLRNESIEALCAVLEAEPEWYASDKRLLIAAGTLDFADEYRKAKAKTEGSRHGTVAELVDVIGERFDRAFSVRAA